jgi:hypothetical protein
MDYSRETQIDKLEALKVDRKKRKVYMCVGNKKGVTYI